MANQVYAIDDKKYGVPSLFEIVRTLDDSRPVVEAQQTDSAESEHFPR